MSSFDLAFVGDRADRAPTAALELLEQALAPRQFGLLVLLGLAAIAVSLVLGHRPLGLFAGGFATLSLVGLTWIYVLTPYDLAFSC